MNTQRLIRIIAGSFIILSLVFYDINNAGPSIFTHLNWLLFTLFVGVNLLQSGITRWCLMEDILKKFGVKS